MRREQLDALEDDMERLASCIAIQEAKIAAVERVMKRIGEGSPNYYLLREFRDGLRRGRMNLQANLIDQAEEFVLAVVPEAKAG